MIRVQEWQQSAWTMIVVAIIFLFIIVGLLIHGWRTR